MRAPGPGQLFGLIRGRGAATQAQSRPRRPRGYRSAAPRCCPGNHLLPGRQRRYKGVLPVRVPDRNWWSRTPSAFGTSPCWGRKGNMQRSPAKRGYDQHFSGRPSWGQALEGVGVQRCCSVLGEPPPPLRGTSPRGGGLLASLLRGDLSHKGSRLRLTSRRDVGGFVV